MIECAARLGDLAPARLGRADHRVRAQGNGRGDPVGRLRKSGELMAAHPPRRSPSRAPMPGSSRARPSASSRGWWPSLATGSRPPTSSTCGSTQAPRMPSRWRTRKEFPGLAGIRRVRDGGQDRVMYLEGSDQHRGWFQSSLLESCGTRGARAVRRRADARLHPRREGRGEDVEVQGQHHVAAGHHEDLRRRHPAPVGGVLRLHQRHQVRARHHPGHGRVLPQAAEHAALDARHAGPLRPQEDGAREGDAGAGAAHAAPADRTRRGTCARPTRSTTTSAWWPCCRSS